MAVNVYQAVKDAMQDLIAPQLASLQGEIAGLRGEMNGLRGEMNGLRGELKAEITGLHGEITGLHGETDSVRRELKAEIDGLRGETRTGFAALRTEMHAGQTTLRSDVTRLDERLTIALDLRERIVALEAKLPH